MNITKLRNLPHVCRIDQGNPGSFLNCGNEYISDYGYFFFDYASKDNENYSSLTMQYKFKFYEVEIHRCYNTGCYCEIRNNLDNILDLHFKYKSGRHDSCYRYKDSATFVDSNRRNCYGDPFKVQNYQRLFTYGFSESIGNGYYINWSLQELLRFNFNEYRMPEKDDGYGWIKGMYETNKRNLELIFDCKIENIESNKLKIASSLLAERVKKPYQFI